MWTDSAQSSTWSQVHSHTPSRDRNNCFMSYEIVTNVYLFQTTFCVFTRDRLLQKWNHCLSFCKRYLILNSRRLVIFLPVCIISYLSFTSLDHTVCPCFFVILNESNSDLILCMLFLLTLFMINIILHSKVIDMMNMVFHMITVPSSALLVSVVYTEEQVVSITTAYSLY